MKIKIKSCEENRVLERLWKCPAPIKPLLVFHPIQVSSTKLETESKFLTIVIIGSIDKRKM